MKVCVIQCGYPEGSEWLKYDPYRVVKQEWIPQATVLDHEVIMPGKDTREQLRKLISRGYDLFINLCDGPIGDPEMTPSVEIVQELKKANIAFTGADEHFWDITREEQKKLMIEAGVPTPGYCFAFKPEEVHKAETLNFPLLVKHWNGPGGSEGLSHKSRVTNVKELHEQAQFMITKYGGCLIEEFIEGSEYTVLVSEDPDNPSQPITYLPMMINFYEGETFKTFAVKWYEFTKMSWVKSENTDVNEKLMFYSKKAFLAQKANSYGRLDWRADKEGNIYYLEMNSQPSIFQADGSEPGSSDYILANSPGGVKGFVDKIVRAAFIAKEKRMKEQQQQQQQQQQLKPINSPSDGAPDGEMEEK